MRAAVFKGDGRLEVESVPMPRIESDSDVLLKVEAASICGSDLHILHVPPGQRGDPGTVMGHEFVATVVAVGQGVETVHAGDRVVVEPNISCGTCPECRGGHENLCANAQNIGQWRDGGFAEYCVVPASQLHAVPDGIPIRLCALAEPLACVMHGMMRLNPMPHERVVLFGAGAIGLIFLRVLTVFGVKDIVVVETMPSRREIAAKLGASRVADPVAEDVPALLKDQWSGLADVAIDAVGAGPVLGQAMDAVRNGGRILVFGQNMTQRSTISPGLINAKELTLFATLAVKKSFPAALAMLRDPRLRLDELISHEFTLSQIGEGVECMRRQEAVKAVIYPGR